MPSLRARGHDVDIIDSGFFDRCGFDAEAPGERRDVRDLDEDQLAGYQAICHLGELCNDPLGSLNPELTYEINHRATMRLATMAKAAGVERFLFASSCSVYGGSDDEFRDEQAPLDPLTPYAECKVMCEEGLSALADRSFAPVYLRNATAYGISPRFRADLVINNLVCWAHATGIVKLLSDGQAWRPLVHVADICTAFRAALEAPRDAVCDQPFNVGRNADNLRIIELAQIVAQVVPGSRVVIDGGANPDQRTYRVNFDKITNELPGFKAEWDAKTGTEDIYRMVRRYDLRVEDFDSRRYVRLKELRTLLDDGALDTHLRWVS